MSEMRFAAYVIILKQKELILGAENQNNNNNDDDNDDNNGNVNGNGMTAMIRKMGMIIRAMNHMMRTDDGADEDEREVEDEGEGEMQEVAKANFLATQKQKV